jgi:predicted SnoaL-like aldol condensation-catalyzing enzyme
MSTQVELLRELVSRFNRGEDLEIERYFTADFRLDQPGAVFRTGHQGAREMMRSLRDLGADAELEILDAVEQGDRVAVRWRASGGSTVTSLLAIYRFENGRIAEDWGVAIRAPWGEQGRRHRD